MGSHPESPAKLGCGKLLEHARCLLDYEVDVDNWVKDMKGSLSLTASIIATMTFQLATNPPGGVVQAGPKDYLNCTSPGASQLCPGTAVLSIENKSTYLAFLICNTISFVASLSVCLLLVSGIPLNHRTLMWVLSSGMCITITSLSLTYMFAASMVNPGFIWSSVAGSVFSVVIIVWASLVVIVGVFHIVHFLVRGVPKCTKHQVIACLW